jgi:hypothetical protein
MSLQGRIIEFLDEEQLRVAYVRRQDHDKLHLIDPREIQRERRSRCDRPPTRPGG